MISIPLDNTSKCLPSANFTPTNGAFILDPLSVIIKLAIIGYKKIGTKIYIDRNIIGIQEPWLLQSIIRFIFKNNRNELQYLYNPIEFACRSFLTNDNKNTKPGIVKLFEGALHGITKLIETYAYTYNMK